MCSFGRHDRIFPLSHDGHPKAQRKFCVITSSKSHSPK
nr:MAG TPA: hypothetical protein [Caudoviricetes sp.]